MRWYHPEWWLGASAVAAWIGLWVAGPALRRRGGMGDGWTPVAPVSVLPHASSEAALWILMTVAMMLPTILPTARHLGLASYWERRHRAIAWYAGGYVAVWVFSGIGLVGAIHVLERVAGPTATVVVAFGAAAAWQRSPRKRAAVGACGRAGPVPSSGVGCLWLGVDVGMSCVTSCWALMTATLAASHSLVVMLVVEGVILWERRTGSSRVGRAIPVITALGAVTFVALRWAVRLP